MIRGHSVAGKELPLQEKAKKSLRWGRAMCDSSQILEVVLANSAYIYVFPSDFKKSTLYGCFSELLD